MLVKGATVADLEAAAQKAGVRLVSVRDHARGPRWGVKGRAYPKGGIRFGIRTEAPAPRWLRAGCMQQVCTCHDDSIEPRLPFECSWCGCKKEQRPKYRRVSGHRTRAGNPGTIPGAVCWHGHRDFMRALFERQPQATLETALITYQGAEDFESKYRSTGLHEVGPRGSGDYRSLCDCEDEDGVDYEDHGGRYRLEGFRVG